METVIRVLIIYFFILVGLRVMGKREFSQMSPLELVTLLLLPEIASQAILREDFSMTNSLVAIATIFSVVFILAIIRYLSKPVEELIEGTPKVLIAEGKFVIEHLNKEHVTPGEIFTEMHKSGFESVEQIKWAIIEPDGKISLIPFEGTQRALMKPDDDNIA